MTYRVGISRRAGTYIRRLDTRMQTRVLGRLAQLSQDPLASAHSKPLTGPTGLRAARVGGLRILFVVDEAAQTVRVAAVGSRGQIYRELDGG